MKLGKITLVKQRDWAETEKLLRQVSLLGDRSILPYKEAKIGRKTIAIREVFSPSYYVISDQLRFQEALREEFLSQHQIDTLDFNGKRGCVEFELEGEEGTFKLAPIIVEVSKVDDNKPIILDGEHRVMLAQKLGVAQVGVVWIEGVSKNLPLVGKPLRWSEVKEYEVTPAVEQKKDYRFKSLEDFPDISEFSQAKVTEDNFRYFFYRDVNGVASTYVRMSGQT